MFPRTRIQHLMRSDEDVGKMAASVPTMVGRAVELFVAELVAQTHAQAQATATATAAAAGASAAIHRAAGNNTVARKIISPLDV